MPSHRILKSKNISSNDDVDVLYKNITSECNRKLMTTRKNVDDDTKKSRILRHTVHGCCNIQKLSIIHFPLPTIAEHNIIHPEQNTWCCNNPLSPWNESTTNSIIDSPCSSDICPKMPQRSSSITHFVDDIDLI